MLYYLETVPVPPNIQAYLQSQQSPRLSYSQETPKQINQNNATNNHKPNERCASATFSRDFKYKESNVSAVIKEKRNRFIANSPRTTNEKNGHYLSKSFTSSRDKTMSKIPRIVMTSSNKDDDINNNNIKDSCEQHSCIDSHQTACDNDLRFSSFESDILAYSGCSSLNSSTDSYGFLEYEQDTLRGRCRSEMSSSCASSIKPRNSVTTADTQTLKLFREKSNIPVAKYRSKSIDRLRSVSHERNAERTRSLSNGSIPVRTQSPGIPLRVQSSSGRIAERLRSRSNGSIPVRTQSPGIPFRTQSAGACNVARPRSNSSIPVRTQSPGIPGRAQSPGASRSFERGRQRRKRDNKLDRSERSLLSDVFVTNARYTNHSSFTANVYRPRIASPRRQDNKLLSSSRPSSRKLSSSSSTNNSLSRSYEFPVAEDYNEIINLLHHDSATQKRDGLLSMQALLQSIRHLSSDEAMRAKEIFNRYFAEPNAKLYSLFLDVLSEFVVQYKNDLKDWLFILLTRLLQRISTDILASAQKKIAQMLDIVRDTYPYDYQFQIITKYITDNTQTPTLKVKESLLQYTRGLIELMDASDFVNSAPIRLAVSRIVTWISEPKSADVRKEASAVILALFQLNSPEFSMMLYSLPSSIQEGATRVIQMGIKHQQPSTPQYSKSLNYTDRTTSYTAPAKSEHMERPLYRTASPAKMANKVTNVREDYNSPAAHNSVTRVPSSGRQDTYGEAAQQEPSNISARNKLSFTSPQYSTPPPFSTPSHDLVTPSANGDTPYSYATHYDAENSPMWLSSTTSYNPRQYEDSLIDTVPNMSLTSPVNRVADGAEQPDGSDDGMENSRNLLNEIGTVLSGSHNTNDSEDVKSALIELLKLTRSGNRDIVGQKLKQLIPSVLTLLKHKEATVRCLAARCLREICHSHPNSYRNNLHAFLLPLLQTESDSQKEVSKTAEECCALISQTLSPAEVLPVVAPLAGESPFPTNVSAIKMLNSVADNCDNRTMIQNIEAVVGNLLKAYDHQESMVRKAAVFCLVSVHNVAGADVVSPYFNELAGSKVKLLNLYIRRSQSSNV